MLPDHFGPGLNPCCSGYSSAAAMMANDYNQMNSVSILVVVDIAPRPANSAAYSMYAVSILVVVDIAPRPFVAHNCVGFLRSQSLL